MRNTVVLYALFIILVLNAVVATACSAPPVSAQASTPTAEATQQRPAVAPTQPAATATPFAALRAVTNVKLVGNLVAANQVSLAFTAAGRVKELPVAEGAAVKAGTLLGSLDTAVLEAQFAQAQATFDVANATWARIQQGPSADDMAVAQANLDRAKAAVDQAQAAYDRSSKTGAAAVNLQTATLNLQTALAQYNLAVNHPTASEREIGQIQFKQAQLALDLAKQNLTNTKLSAPFDGTLLSITPKIGESVGANTAVMVLADLTKMQVLVNADETTLANIKVGQKARITADAIGDRVLTGVVQKIGLIATTTTTVVTVPVWIDIDPTDARLYPGLSATVEIATGS
ncbi:MAG: HlyD family secretion protein [Chloroflexi bacterium]|nr:HlyD family secretion protein [Chloroflexota bacterium]